MVQHQVKEYFPKVPKIAFEGQNAKNALAYREYNASEVIMGKTMEEWCRFAVCYWHTFGNTGSDPFGGETYTNRLWNESLENTNLSSRERLLEVAKCKADAAFEMFTKLGVKYYTFHDVDLISEGANLEESQSLLDEISDYLLDKQNQTGVKCLWGTTNLFGHRRFMNGASTNPDMKVFAHAAARVKKAMEITLKLGGENFVFWGGREGFQSILNTDMKTELDHMAAFFKLVVAYKKELGATFQLLVEPKPREPMKHQYDYDAATVMAFLHTYGLQNDFKLNIEPNHTTLAGHDYEHDIYYAASYKMLGSVDCNTGDPLVGWDTDQFLMDEKKAVLVMKKIIEIGGLAPGGLNFDAKVRRESTDLEDIFIAHIGSMDCFARGLRQAAKLLEKNELGEMVKQRYASWKSALGERIEQGKATLEEVAAYAKESGEPDHVSGKQELAELMLFRGVQ
ncbi:xylose isomerase [Phytophthora nicotianae CJ01A1]|uniref:Xylose isomerase n=5 Tax=Phytophthora nicotianae TaxID=4792 RepID=W2M2T2_PHYNI|nr:xylose isomerase [Phytophthora nicotianae]ETO82200.1 xylose isomerase [Phytophthora nicotianae P1976]ETP23318.1 xylose isomerase [Phytophthora nicotianae CJ01A1]ETL99919.1 xylose isomerase [Phytophthora nicotianae]ETM30630.1 xylose isomerase [Phytophthora nicotianae]